MTDTGGIVTPHDVGQALEQHIRTWQRTALDLIAPGRGFSRRLESIRTYRHSNERPEKWDDDDVPCCVIVVGPSEASQGSDTFSLVFTAAVAVVVGARADVKATNARAKASVYAGALARLLNERPGLTIGPDQISGEIAGWGGFDTGEISSTLAVGVCGYTIFVSDALVLGDWPSTPIPDPAPGVPPDYPDTPTAETVNVTVDQLAQEG